MVSFMKENVMCFVSFVKMSFVFFYIMSIPLKRNVILGNFVFFSKINFTGKTIYQSLIVTNDIAYL